LRLDAHANAASAFANCGHAVAQIEDGNVSTEWETPQRLVADLDRLPTPGSRGGFGSTEQETMKMNTLTTTVLTEAELNGVSGGRGPAQNTDGWSPPVSQMNPVAYAIAYWQVGGVSTFGDFWYQLTN
jgi:hypothetical protein